MLEDFTHEMEGQLPQKKRSVGFYKYNIYIYTLHILHEPQQ